MCILEGEVKENVNILPIYYPSPIIMFAHQYIPLSIMLVKEMNFLYSNYIQLYKPPVKNYIFDFYPNSLESSVINNEFDIVCLKGIIDIKKSDIIDQAINWIDNGYYLAIHSNESIIPGNQCYGMKPMLHQSLYYGYDSNKKVFKMLTYDNNKRFTTLDVTYDIFCEAVSSDLTRELCSKKSDLPYPPIRLWRVNDKVAKYNNQINRVYKSILTGLEDYLYCRDSEQSREINFPTNENSVWGMDIYKLIDSCLKGEIKTEYELQNICGIYEHKKVMYDRLVFLKENEFITNPDLIEKYDAIQKKAFYFKNLSFKCRVFHNINMIRELITTIDEIKNEEQKVLTEVCNEMIKNGSNIK